jgi:hypothetical protein
MSKLTIKASQLSSVAFWQSFNKLTGLSDLDGKATVSLYRLKRDFASEVELLKESLSDAEEGTIKEALSADIDFETELTLDPVDLSVNLSADDLYQLEPLFQ